MNTLTFKVPGISCGHCVHTIQTEVRDLAGVKTVQADQNSKLVKVDFEQPATREGIEALLKEINYPAESVVIA
jgi:copper chaperone CopZ